MTDTLDNLLEYIVAHPQEAPSTWLVIADWLEEHNDPRWELIRLRHDTHYRPDLNPAAREDRVQELLAGGMIPCVPRMVNSIDMEFAWIPPGRFLMGSPENEPDRSQDEGPQHEVEILQPFYLGIHQVTQQDYQKVMKTNPSWFCHAGGGKEKVKELDTGRLPVEYVSWVDSNQFCTTLSELPVERSQHHLYRLPTEAEWEYACRSGAGCYQVFSFGNQLSLAQANFCSDPSYCGGAYPDRPVSGDISPYRPNAYGLLHMHGNVKEWCQDCYAKDYYQACLSQGIRCDPQGPQNTNLDHRVLRGGSWDDGAWLARSANRSSGPPDFRDDYIGFRVVCVRTPQAKS